MKRTHQTILVFCCLFLLSLINGCSEHSAEKEAIGATISAQLEKYRAEHGTFPPDLSHIGVELKLEGPIYYEKVSSDHYTLYYGASLGESVIYDSKRKTWE